MRDSGYQANLCENVRTSCHEPPAGTNYLDFGFCTVYFWCINHALNSKAMKKVIAIMFAVLVTAGAYAFDPNEKVLKAFNETFTSAQEVRWEEFPKYFSVSFVSGGIRSKVNYDKEGNMMSSLRYYAPQLLPLYILNKINKENPNKKMFGVTEVTYNGTIAYYIKLEDEKRWYTLKVDVDGNSQMTEKYKKV
jgi:hypothetical protein